VKKINAEGKMIKEDFAAALRPTRQLRCNEESQKQVQIPRKRQQR